MSDNSTRDLLPSEEAFIDDVLRRLRTHFREWRCAEGHEHHLVAFAYYEGCGGSDHCGELLAEAAPFALGRELVSNHGFRWIMLAAGEEWRYGVMHPALEQPIDLISLEEGSWNHEEYDEPPAPGRTTHDSLEPIVTQVGQFSSEGN
jgi:hypothetical protein